jgi:hypothetical protein
LKKIRVQDIPMRILICKVCRTRGSLLNFERKM